MQEEFETEKSTKEIRGFFAVEKQVKCKCQGKGENGEKCVPQSLGVEAVKEWEESWKVYKRKQRLQALKEWYVKHFNGRACCSSQ